MLEKRKSFIYKTEAFKTIVIDLYFPFVLEDKDIIASYILPNLLIHTSDKYKTEDAFYKKISENSILSLSCSRTRFGKQWFYHVYLIIPDEKSFGEDVSKKALEFLFDTVYHPNIQNGAFSKKEFETEKKCIEMKIKNQEKNIGYYSYQRIIEIVDTLGDLKNDVYHNREQFKTVTPQSIYKFYQKTIQKTLPFVFVFGNIEKEKIEALLDKYLYNKDLKQISYQKNYTRFLSRTNSVVVYKEDKGPYYRSYLAHIYKVKDMKEEDIPLLRVIERLLSSQSSSMLHKNLRDKEGLVYYTGCDCYTRSGMIIVEAELYKDNKEKTSKVIESTMKQLLDKKTIAPLLDNIKDRKRLNLEREKDNKFSLISDIIDTYFEYDDTAEVTYQKLVKITVEEICQFAKRLELDTVYFLKGEKE